MDFEKDILETQETKGLLGKIARIGMVVVGVLVGIGVITGAIAGAIKIINWIF